MLGPRSMGQGAGTYGPESSFAARHHPTTGQAEDYFSLGTRLPPSQGQRTGLEHRRSAKRLIDQYERLGSPPPNANGYTHGVGGSGMARTKSTKNRQYVYDYRDNANGNTNAHVPAPTRPTPTRTKSEIAYLETPPKKQLHLHGLGKKDKDKSPIRQSLRNLFSVLKKGAGGLTLTSSKRNLLMGDVGGPYDGHMGAAVAPRTHAEAQAQVQGPKAQRATPLAAPKNAKNMAGSLLYLTRVIPPSELIKFPSPIPIDISRSTSLSYSGSSAGIGQLAWTTCNVTCSPTPGGGGGAKLILSSFTSELQLVVHEIDLSGCTDIRSLSVSQLSDEEARLLEVDPGAYGHGNEGVGGGPKVFELKFKGSKPKEKFAARSVRERAGWISAIWDVILPENQAESCNTRMPVEVDASSSKASSETSPEPLILPKQKPIESPIPKPLPQMCALLSSSFSERSLPPVPPDGGITPPPPSAETATPPSIPEKERGREQKRPPNLHLDIPPLRLDSLISPSIYPPTSCASSSGSTPLDTPGNGREGIRLGSSQPSTPTTIRGDLLSPTSTYSASFRPSSAFGSALSPTRSSASSCPNSPSIANLSQLSMVRQRLAQIERNHSQLSERSQDGSRTSSPVRTATPGAGPGPGCIPMPMSPARSGWLRREAVFHNSSAMSSLLPTPKGMSSTSSREISWIGSPRKAGRGENSRVSSPLSEDPEEDAQRRNSEHTRQRGLDRVPSPQAAARPASEDIKGLSTGLANIKGVLGGESGCPTIHQVVVGLEHRLHRDGKTLKAIHTKVNQLDERVTNAVASSSSSSVDGNDSQENILRAVETIRRRLEAEFPALSGKMQDIREAQAQSEKEKVVYSNVAPSNAPAIMSTELKPLLDKLDGFRTLLEANKTTGEGKDPQVTECLDKILVLVQEEGHKQTLLSQQQADSVRYLNELNTWLELFVNNGTSQIQGLAAGIEQLCSSFGCNPQAPGTSPDNAPNLLNDIRQLVMGMHARDQNFSALQAAVRSLLEVLSASHARMGADSQAIAGLIDSQRRDQEALFRSLTNEISGEIKGERLRFVEAMKEATAINVQLHVEQLKQELSREVMAMTEEVRRLHNEKQQVENQISDLFAFYSKHKQELPLSAIQNVGHVSRQQERQRVNIPRASQQRPLPHPR